jgi:DNA-dependent RNA polymerase auxiliary subunit epsilon
MNIYKIYFEFLGKKQQIQIEAKSEYDARTELEQRLNIHKIALISGKEPDYDEHIATDFNVDALRNMFGMK